MPIMKHFVLVLLLFSPFHLFSKVIYLNNGDSIPAGVITAVEARVKLSSARQGRLAQWTLGWETDSLTVTFDCRNLIDGVGEPLLTIKCGGVSLPAPGLNFSGGWNSVAVEWDGETARLLSGDNLLELNGELSGLPRPTAGTLTVSAPSGKLAVADLIVETGDFDLSSLMTDCNVDLLDVWEYLDSTESKSARLGGAYRLGLMKTTAGYDLVYLSGARVNADAWQPGMRKARLIATAYQGHYLLEWIDATGRPLPGENYAVLDAENRTLTLEFPAFPLSVRFVAP